MKTQIFLINPLTSDAYELLCEVELEVVPRGFYIIEGKTYQFVGQPKFFIDKKRAANGSLLADNSQASLTMVELLVSEVFDTNAGNDTVPL